jgi:hypothetical protein
MQIAIHGLPPLIRRTILGNDFVRLPSGTGLREAVYYVLEIGPLHNFLEKEFQ